MDTSRSQQILEQMLKNDTFETDYIIKTKTKAFKVHRAVIDLAMHACVSEEFGEREWILNAPNFIAEDFVRHSYGLQVPRLQCVTGSEPATDQVLQVFELFIEARKASLWDLQSDCHDWMNDSLRSSSQKAGLLDAIVEYLAETEDENDEEVWEIKADLVQNIADWMEDILADDEALLERIFKFKLLRYLVLQELGTRSKSLEELEEKLKESKAE